MQGGSVELESDGSQFEMLLDVDDVLDELLVLLDVPDVELCEPLEPCDVLYVLGAPM